MSEKQINAVMVEKQVLHDHLFVFKFKPEGWTIPDFKPGQFSSLGIFKPDSTPEKPKLLRRAYSIASSPKEKAALEFYITLVDEGALTPKLAAMNVGDRLWMDPQLDGHFTLDPIPPGRDLVLISTGTGLAPYISMLRTYNKTGRWRKLVILNGVRVARDLAYVDELNRACAEDPNIHFIPMVTREPNWGGRCGRVNSFFEGDEYQKVVGVPLDPATTHVLLCGNPDMIDSMQKFLEERGFREYHQRKSPDGNVHFERYW